MGLGGHDAGYQHMLLAVVAIAFAAMVALGALLYRRAARRAELEEIDRLLDE
jgi:hypothetical protein